MLTLTQLTQHLDELLQPETPDNRLKDYAPNGLQVEGCREVRRIITGVSASRALIEAAIEARADAILVHHGYFWNGEPAPLVGMKGARIKRLMHADISLIAYHLPLDIHPTLGNNALWGKAMGWQVRDIQKNGLLYVGEVASVFASKAGQHTGQSVADMADQLSQTLNRAPLHLSGGAHNIRRIAWCSGAAQDFITDVAELGDIDAFFSGEVSERTTHLAAELGIHYFASGHHATETFGVAALAHHLNATFGDAQGVHAEFINLDNPV